MSEDLNGREKFVSVFAQFANQDAKFKSSGASISSINDEISKAEQQMNLLDITVDLDALILGFSSSTGQNADALVSLLRRLRRESAIADGLKNDAVGSSQYHSRLSQLLSTNPSGSETISRNVTYNGIVIKDISFSNGIGAISFAEQTIDIDAEATLPPIEIEIDWDSSPVNFDRLPFASVDVFAPINTEIVEGTLKKFNTNMTKANSDIRGVVDALIAELEPLLPPEPVEPPPVPPLIDPPISSEVLNWVALKVNTGVHVFDAVPNGMHASLSNYINGGNGYVSVVKVVDNCFLALINATYISDIFADSSSAMEGLNMSATCQLTLDMTGLVGIECPKL